MMPRYHLPTCTTNIDIANWIGNGDPDCAWIVVGQEEGGAGTNVQAQHFYDYWCTNQHPLLTDWRSKQQYLLTKMNAKDFAGDSNGTQCSFNNGYILKTLKLVHWSEQPCDGSAIAFDHVKCSMLRSRYGRNRRITNCFAEEPTDIITTLESSAYVGTTGDIARDIHNLNGVPNPNRYILVRDWILDRLHKLPIPPRVVIQGKKPIQGRLFNDLCAISLGKWANVNNRQLHYVTKKGKELNTETAVLMRKDGACVSIAHIPQGNIENEYLRHVADFFRCPPCPPTPAES